MTMFDPIQNDAQSPSKVPQANLARQPILDNKLKTVGYELLFRGNETDRALFEDGTRATSTVLTNALSEFGLETVVGTLPAWVNFTAQYLIDELPIPIGPKSLVVELLEDAVPTDELVQRLRTLTKLGYRIALDDFTYRDDLKPLLEVAQVVKVDIRGRSLEEIAHEAESFKKFNVQLLAEKVERVSEYEACLNSDSAYFKGISCVGPS